MKSRIYVHSMICAPTNRVAADLLGEPLGKNVVIGWGGKATLKGNSELYRDMVVVC